MTDGSPLVSIRRSLARVKSEITGMDNDGNTNMYLDVPLSQGWT